MHLRWRWNRDIVLPLASAAAARACWLMNLQVCMVMELYAVTKLDNAAMDAMALHDDCSRDILEFLGKWSWAGYEGRAGAATVAKCVSIGAHLADAALNVNGCGEPALSRSPGLALHHKTAPCVPMESGGRRKGVGRKVRTSNEHVRYLLFADGVDTPAYHQAGGGGGSGGGHSCSSSQMHNRDNRTWDVEVCSDDSDAEVVDVIAAAKPASKHIECGSAMFMQVETHQQWSGGSCVSPWASVFAPMQTCWSNATPRDQNGRAILQE